MAVQITSSRSGFENSSRPMVRTSTGILYLAFCNKTDDTVEVWKSSDGTSWTEQDTGNSPVNNSGDGSVVCAIDSSDILHIVYNYENGSSPADYDLKYVTFDTEDGGATDDAFNTPAVIGDAGINCQDISIAIDSNDVPHISFIGNPGGKTNNDTVTYINKVGGSWNTQVEVEGYTASKDCYRTEIAIDKDDIPVIIYLNDTDDDVGTATGNLNNATSFTLFDVETDGENNISTARASICVDTDGNHWVSWIDNTNQDVHLKSHDYGDAWNTWNTTLDKSETAKNTSVVAIGTDIYVFFIDINTSDVIYDMYNGSWAGNTTLETGSYEDVTTKWSYNNDNQSSIQIDVYFRGKATIPDRNTYWSKLVLGEVEVTYQPRQGFIESSLGIA